MYMNKFLTITIFLTIVNIATIAGQTVKSYFIPTNGYNKATFYTPNKTTGEATEMTRRIYYVQKGTSYDLTDAKLFQGQPSSIVTKTVQFVGNEVKMIKSISTDLTVTNKKRTYNPAQTIFKLPAVGQTATWTIPSVGDGTLKYTASWTTVVVDGKTKKAIKVVETIPNFSAKMVEYYVSGIGLWKSEIQSEGKSQTSDKFDELSYDTTATEEAEENNSNSLIAKYEKCVINGQKPAEANVQTKYDNRDFRAIIFGDKLSNVSLYTRQEIEKLGYEYLKITVDDYQHRTYSYRNCKKNILLDITEWYNYKISIDIQWFSNSVKPTIGYLMYCD